MIGLPIRPQLRGTFTYFVVAAPSMCRATVLCTGEVDVGHVSILQISANKTATVIQSIPERQRPCHKTMVMLCKSTSSNTVYSQSRQLRRPRSYVQPSSCHIFVNASFYDDAIAGACERGKGRAMARVTGRARGRARGRKRESKRKR